jgi:hypothetical protein
MGMPPSVMMSILDSIFSLFLVSEFLGSNVVFMRNNCFAALKIAFATRRVRSLIIVPEGFVPSYPEFFSWFEVGLLTISTFANACSKEQFLYVLFAFNCIIHSCFGSVKQQPRRPRLHP